MTTIADELAKKQQAISISEFFEKNRHLLGFDNPRKALLTTIKEAVDNSLDATEEARILPLIKINIKQLSENRFKIIVEDNGPGIVKKQIPFIFARLLYGSKFFKLAMSRGQQGIGISAAVLYAQLTTGKPAKITSKIDPKKPAHYYEVYIDTKKNEPEILVDKEVSSDINHGTKIELEIEAIYQKGARSVDDYLKQTAIANPHAYIIYNSPDNKRFIFSRATDKLPFQPKEIKPHPYGIELGILIRMLKITKARTLQSFLTNDFSRVGSKTAKKICELAELKPNTHPSRILHEEAEKLFNAIQKTKLIAPPTNCISPIGAEALQKSLEKEIPAEFFASTTRPASVYRGNPFVIEAALGFGGKLETDKPIKLLRFANRVPLQYQQSACAITKSVIETNWRNYGLQRSRGALPSGPLILVVHMASVWVPFTSESKEAIAHYPEIIKEIKLAIQECGRRLANHIRQRKKEEYESKRKSYIEKYLPHIGIGLKEILNLNNQQEKKLINTLKITLEKSRK